MLYGDILFIPEKSVEKVCSHVQNRFYSGFRIMKISVFSSHMTKLLFIPDFDENKKSLRDLIPKRLSYLNELRGKNFKL